jgi:hypothetical protein
MFASEGSVTKHEDFPFAIMLVQLDKIDRIATRRDHSPGGRSKEQLALTGPKP